MGDGDDKPSRGSDRWPHRPSDSITDVAQQAISVMLLSANEQTGEVNGLGYWQAANAYTAAMLCYMVPSKHHDESRAKRKRQGIAIIERQLSRILDRQRHCINDFNDDTLWYAHLMLCISDLSSSSSVNCAHHLDKIVEHISRSTFPAGSITPEGRDISGAVFWRSNNDCREVNSITTGLWAELCARLVHMDIRTAGGISKPVLFKMACRSLGFIKTSLYDDKQVVVLDTLKLETDEVVPWAFTYTTGQAIAAAVAIHEALPTFTALCEHDVADVKDSSVKGSVDDFLVWAVHLAKMAVTRQAWVQDGVLTEYSAYGPENHTADQNDDAVGFKSVLIRSLAKLWSYFTKCRDYGLRLPEPVKAESQQVCNQIRQLIVNTYESLLKHNTNGIGQYGPWWAGPWDMSTSHSQHAVIDVMAAMELVMTK